MYEGVCVGGSKHGQMFVNPSEIMRIHIPQPVPAAISEMSVGMMAAVEANYEEYIHEKLHFDHGEPIQFWRHKESLPTFRDAVEYVFKSQVMQ